MVKVTFPADNGAELLTHDQVWEHLKAMAQAQERWDQIRQEDARG